MLLAHLLASPFFGGPERQMLSLARHLLPDCDSVFLSFAEQGKARPLLTSSGRKRFRGDRTAGEHWPVLARRG